jgi:hypothetical protein
MLRRFFLAVCFVFLGVEQAIGCDFTPNTDDWKDCLSPDGAFTLFARMNPKSGKSYGDDYTLNLQGKGSRDVLLMTWGRDVTTLWSPDSKKIIVADYAGSNATETFVFDVKKPNRKAKVSAMALSYKRPDWYLSDWDHLYWEGLKWLDNEKILVEVRGDIQSDQPKRIDKLIVLNLTSKSWLEVPEKDELWKVTRVKCK